MGISEKKGIAVGIYILVVVFLIPKSHIINILKPLMLLLFFSFKDREQVENNMASVNLAHRVCNRHIGVHEEVGGKKTAPNAATTHSAGFEPARA